jgi:hypothetical protein
MVYIGNTYSTPDDAVGKITDTSVYVGCVTDTSAGQFGAVEGLTVIGRRRRNGGIDAG